MEDISAELVGIRVDSKNISIRVLQQKDTLKSFVATISQVRELTIYDSPTWPKDIIVQPFRDTAGSRDKEHSSQKRSNTKKSIHMLSRNAADRVANTINTKPEDMSGDQKRIHRTADSDDRESHTTIIMSPESIITGTPIMTDSHGGITMMRSSQISTEEAISDTTTR